MLKSKARGLAFVTFRTIPGCGALHFAAELRMPQGVSEHKAWMAIRWGSQPGPPMEVGDPLWFSTELGVYVDVFIFSGKRTFFT